MVGTLDCPSGATVESEPVIPCDAPGICAEVDELGTSASSATAIRRMRSIGVSMDVLTIHSWRAVRLRMRESCSTSDASAVRLQDDAGRTWADSRSAPNWWVCGKDLFIASPDPFWFGRGHKYCSESCAISWVCRSSDMVGYFCKRTCAEHG